MWLNKYFYYPQGVEATWLAISNELYRYVTHSGFTPQPIFELDVLDDQSSFPPINNGHPNQPGEFDCTPLNFPNSQSPCQISPDDVIFSDVEEQFIGTRFVESVLITDLISQNKLAWPTSWVSSQDDGLTQSSPLSTYETVHHQPSPLPNPIPCWTALTRWEPVTEPGGIPVIGMQFGNNVGNFTTTTLYEQALQRGISFGAQYEELWPFEIANYIALQGAATTIGNVSGALMNNYPSSQVNYLCYNEQGPN